jgi:hypothetical protein
LYIGKIKGYSRSGQRRYFAHRRIGYIGVDAIGCFESATALRQKIMRPGNGSVWRPTPELAFV